MRYDFALTRLGMNNVRAVERDFRPWACLKFDHFAVNSVGRNR